MTLARILLGKRRWRFSLGNSEAMLILLKRIHNYSETRKIVYGWSDNATKVFV